MTYRPDPLDTCSVKLPDALTPLVERLAEHVHDMWAKRRIKEGWSYGPERNDDVKTHPGLVPYEELSEAEKDYDRQTALETLKAVRVLGYGIVPPEDVGDLSSG